MNIFEALESGDLEEVKKLINNGVNIAVITPNNDTILHHAVKYIDDDEIIETLIKNGLDPNATNNYGETPLHIAIKHTNNPNTIEVLIRNGADVNAIKFGLETPLHYAAKYTNKPDIIQILINNNAFLNVKNYRDETPLHYAAMYNDNPHVFELFIKNRANIDARNYKNETPLHYATKNTNNYEIISTLVSSGSHLGAVNVKNETPLHYAAENTDNPNIIRKLIRYGACLHALCNEGCKPLDKAAKHNVNPEIIEALIRNNNFQINTKVGRKQQTPLNHAIFNKNRDIMIFLLEIGCDINTLDCKKKTPLHYLADSHDDSERIKILLKYGAIVDSIDINGETPLHLAAKSNNINIAKALAKSGANIYLKNKQGQTPLDLSKTVKIALINYTDHKKGRENLFEVLQQNLIRYGIQEETKIGALNVTLQHHYNKDIPPVNYNFDQKKSIIKIVVPTNKAQQASQKSNDGKLLEQQKRRINSQELSNLKKRRV